VGIRRILGPWNKPEAIPRNRRWIPNEIEAAIFRVEIPVIFQIPIKNPVFGRKTGFFSTSPFTVFHRRPIVKRIQAGFLAYGSSYSLPLPILDPSASSGLRIVDLASFVPDYSGVAVPDSHGVPFSASSHLNTDQFLVISYHNF
jgi:hypothetical protein